MKKAFYILLLCVSLSYAQEVATIEGAGQLPYKRIENNVSGDQLLKKEDFNLLDGRMLVTAFPCTIRNNDTTNTILVSVVCQQKAFNEFGVEKINNMILVANEKVHSSLNVQHNYLPKEIKMAYIPDSHDWSLTSSFTEQDADGVIKDRLLALEFDTHGKFAVMKRIL
jgi:hypothetical protein